MPFSFLLFLTSFKIFFLSSLTAFLVLFTQVVQIAHMAEEWVDYAHSKLKDEEARRVSAMKNLVVTENKNKDLTVKLTEADRESKSVEATLAGIEKEVEGQRQHL